MGYDFLNFMEKSISRRRFITLAGLSPFILANCASLGIKYSGDPSLKKLDMPPVRGFDLMGCTSYIVKGISDYYGLNKSLERINKDLKKGFWKPSFVTNIAAVLSGYGLNVDFYYLKNYSDSIKIYENMIPIEKLPEKGVKIHNKRLPLEEITYSIDKENPTISFVNHRTLMGIPKENLNIGHVVAIKGYSEDYLYLNDTSKIFGERKVKKEIFEKSRIGIPLECSIILSKSL